MRLTGLDSHNTAILVGIETGHEPQGDTEPPVDRVPLWDFLKGPPG